MSYLNFEEREITASPSISFTLRFNFRKVRFMNEIRAEERDSTPD